MLLQIVNTFKEVISNAFNEISVHGFVHLVRTKSNILERIIWFCCICMGLYGVVDLSIDIWDRFQTSPTVISMDRNKFFWNTSFPSLTVCPTRRIDDILLKEYFDDNPTKYPNESIQEEFKGFINALATLSFDNMDVILKYNDFNISSENYLELVYNLTWKFIPEISSGTTNKLYMVDTVTEIGICYAVNSKMAQYNSFSYWKKNKWNILPTNDTVVVHPLDGEIYAQIINLSTSYEVFFHGAIEVPDISKQRNFFPETDYTTIELLALEIITDKGARDLKVSQRKCRFTHESEKMMLAPVYSYNLCRTECRFKLSYKLCKCIPYFYRTISRSGRKYPVCGYAGIECLKKYKDELISLQSKKMDLNCFCEPNCDNANFFIQAYRSRVWFLGANLQWGINDYPKMQLKRDLLFGFTDVLVYIGGLGGLFLGCSILGLAELTYFFTWNLIKSFWAKSRNKIFSVKDTY